MRVVDVSVLAAAVERGRVRGGLHEATRTISQLGLPVIQAQFVDRVAEAELVRARELRQVAGKRVRPLVAFHGIPPVGIADDVEVAPAAAHEEEGDAAVSRVAAEVLPAVHPWDAQRLHPKFPNARSLSCEVWFIFEMPNVASKTIVGLIVHVSPKVYICTVVSPTSDPS